MIRTPFLAQALIVTTLLLSQAECYKGPQHKSLRPHAMGNAFVALAVDKEAIHYNPAGLALMNRLGNFEKRPDLGYYPSNWFDARLGIGGYFLGPSYREAMQGWNLWKDHRNTFDKMNSNSDSIATYLSKDSTLFSDMLVFDRRPLGGGLIYDMELAMHGFGAALWADSRTGFFIDPGILVPGLGIQTSEAFATGQLAGAWEVNEKWSLGMGYRLVKGVQVVGVEIGLDNAATMEDTLKQRLDDLISEVEPTDPNGYSHALDFGAMYQWKRDVRFGAALQQVYLGELLGHEVTPELTVGMAWSPKGLQSNTNYTRAVNFALDFEDLLNSDKNYKFASKINFGAEVEQTLLAFPYVRWASDLRLIKGRLSGGFKGGYWCAGAGLELLRVVNLDVATWAEEEGYVTGQSGQRYVAGLISIGL